MIIGDSGMQQLPQVQHVVFALPRLGDGPTELLLLVLNVRLPVKDLDEVEVAVIGFLWHRLSME